MAEVSFLPPSLFADPVSYVHSASMTAFLPQHSNLFSRVCFIRRHPQVALFILLCEQIISDASKLSKYTKH